MIPRTGLAQSVSTVGVKVDLRDAALRVKGRWVEVSTVKHRVGKRTDSDAVNVPEGTPTAGLGENDVEAIKT